MTKMTKISNKMSFYMNSIKVQKLESRLQRLTSKGQMVFFEFWSRSHFLSLQPNILIFLGFGRLFDIYLGMKF